MFYYIPSQKKQKKIYLTIQQQPMIRFTHCSTYKGRDGNISHQYPPKNQFYQQTCYNTNLYHSLLTYNDHYTTTRHELYHHTATKICSLCCSSRQILRKCYSAQCRFCCSFRKLQRILRILASGAKTNPTARLCLQALNDQRKLRFESFSQILQRELPLGQAFFFNSSSESYDHFNSSSKGYNHCNSSNEGYDSF